MRILLITDKFAPERGGSQIIFSQWYAHLPHAEVTVLTRDWPGSQEFDRSYPHRVVRVPYSRIPKLRSPMLWRDLAREAERLCCAERFDQIHCGQTVETAPAAARIARRYGLPMVLHTFAEDVTTYLRHPFYLPILRQALRDSAMVTSISRYTVDHLRRLGVENERIQILYPGITPGLWSPTGREQEIRQRYGLGDKRVLLTVSRLIPRKGQDTVLQAMPEVLAVVPNAEYLIVGGGPEEARLRALSERLGVAQHVKFVGSIPNTETVDYYHACDVFVMPNRQMPNGDIEGFGLVFLEANACGKPVVGGRSGGTVDAIAHEESGFLVDPLSTSELAGYLIRLFREPELCQRLGEQGRARVHRDFSWEQSGEVLHSVCERAAGSGRAQVSAAT